jgi:hypothetical protein
MRNKLTRGLLASLAATATAGGLMAIPASASAQAYPYQGGYYDPCARDTTSRSTIGGLTGAAIGAAVGSNVAARGVRTEGSVIGGLLGAVIGSNVGRQSAACRSAPQPYQAPPVAYESRSPYQDYGYGVAPAQPYQPQPYGRDYGYQAQPYGGQPYGYPVSSGPSDGDDCRLAESPIYLPDGQVQKRFVRVCRDSSGRYQVVD